MRQVTVVANISSGGDTPTYSTAPVILDQYQAPFQVTYVLSSGATGTVKVTTTDPYPVVNQDFVEATFNWVDAPTTAPNATGFLGQPFRAIYLTGSAQNDTLTVIQSGVKG